MKRIARNTAEKVMTAVRLEPEFMARVRKFAFEQDLSLTKLFEEALRFYMESKNAKVSV